VPALDDIAQTIQIAGAVLSAGAVALLHFEIATSSALRYLLPNLVGSMALATSAWLDRQWGFLLLEAAWIVVATYAVTGRIRGRRVRAASH
jgi:hypothetical protein